MGAYHDALGSAMMMLAEDERTIFLGQGISDAGGTTMSSTLRAVPAAKRLEMPVAEELQMGMAIGMALEGWLPVCIFPRWNFVLRAADQLVNHLDRLPIYSAGDFIPRVIIRTAVPSVHPFNPQAQHDDDFSDAFERMLRTVAIFRLRSADDVVRDYEAALARRGSSILVEYTEHYRDERAQDHRSA